MSHWQEVESSVGLLHKLPLQLLLLGLLELSQRLWLVGLLELLGLVEVLLNLRGVLQLPRLVGLVDPGAVVLHGHPNVTRRRHGRRAVGASCCRGHNAGSARGTWHGDSGMRLERGHVDVHRVAPLGTLRNRRLVGDLLRSGEAIRLGDSVGLPRLRRRGGRMSSGRVGSCGRVSGEVDDLDVGSGSRSGCGKRG